MPQFAVSVGPLVAHSSVAHPAGIQLGLCASTQLPSYGDGCFLEVWLLFAREGTAKTRDPRVVLGGGRWFGHPGPSADAGVAASVPALAAGLSLGTSPAGTALISHFF